MGTSRSGRCVEIGARLIPEIKSTRQLYGRRHGKKLRPRRQALIDTLLPALRITPRPGLDPASLFDHAPSAVWLEVGFGAGEHLAAQAQRRSDVGLIGCEPYVNGLASMLALIDGEGLTNIRIHDDDARLLIDSLADASIERMFLLFPDPWPKARHHKRRFVSLSTLDACARILADGAELRLATDDVGYCRWMLAHLARHDAFCWMARRPSDWRQRPDDWPPTRYEAKAREQGRAPVFLRYRRNPR